MEDTITPLQIELLRMSLNLDNTFNDFNFELMSDNDDEFNKEYWIHFPLIHKNNDSLQLSLSDWKGIHMETSNYTCGITNPKYKIIKDYGSLLCSSVFINQNIKLKEITPIMKQFLRDNFYKL